MEIGNTKKNMDICKIIDIGEYKVGVLIKVRNWGHGEDFCTYLEYDNIAGIVIADGVSSEKNSYEVAKSVCNTFLNGLKRYYEYCGSIDGYILNFENKYIKYIINDLRNKNLTGASTFASVIIHNDKIYTTSIGNTDIYLLSINYLDYIKPNIKQNLDILTAAVNQHGASDNVQTLITKIYENPLIIILGTDGARISENITMIFEKIKEIYNNIYKNYSLFNINKFLEEINIFFDEYISDKKDDDASIGILIIYNIKNICIKYILDADTYVKEIFFNEYPWSFIKKIEIELPDQDRKFTAVGEIYMNLVKVNTVKDLNRDVLYTEIVFDLIIKNKYKSPIIKIYPNSDYYQIKYECENNIDVINNKMICINIIKSTHQDENIFRCRFYINLEDIKNIYEKNIKGFKEKFREKIAQEINQKIIHVVRNKLDEIIDEVINENKENN